VLLQAEVARIDVLLEILPQLFAVAAGEKPSNLFNAFGVFVEFGAGAGQQFQSVESVFLARLEAIVEELFAGFAQVFFTAFNIGVEDDSLLFPQLAGRRGLRRGRLGGEERGGGKTKYG
jgi:hypothetical protein